ncbi:MAG: hypothetical protein QXZ14_01885 [Candidatus Jordarchaeales archaeon]
MSEVKHIKDRYFKKRRNFQAKTSGGRLGKNLWQNIQGEKGGR